MGASQRFAGTLPSGQSLSNVAAGALIGNVVQGTMFEINGPRPRAVQIWGCQDTVANSDLVVQITYGTVVAVEDGFSLPKVIAADAGTGPEIDRHQIAEFMMPPLSRLKISVRNQGSAASGAGTGARLFIKLQDF